MKIVPLHERHVDQLVEFFGRLPPGDLTFVKEDVGPDAVRGWPGGPAQQWVALDDDGTVAGYVCVRRLIGWSNHVAELRLVVDPNRRGAGIGKSLARHAVIEAVRAGRRKVVVELAADQDGALNMFSALGFEGEALLRDHIRDRSGELRDLVMLAHFVDSRLAAMDAAGITPEFA